MVPTAIFVATLLSIYCVYTFLSRSDRKAGSSQWPALTRWLPKIVAVLLFPLAWWLGFIVGGNFGGGWGSLLDEKWSLAGVGVVIGLGLGIFLVTTAIEMLAIFVVSILVKWTLMRRSAV